MSNDEKKCFTVTMQYGTEFLQPLQTNSIDGSGSSQYGHGVAVSSNSDLSGFLQSKIPK